MTGMPLKCRRAMIRDDAPAIPKSCPKCGLGKCRDGLPVYYEMDRKKPTKLYLAAPFADRRKMELVAIALQARGYIITARWVHGGEDGLTREDIAKLDLDDVDAADAVVSFTFPRGTPSTGGGRHVEFGYGLARGKRCIVIGHRENVFHHFPGVEVYPTLESWLEGALPASACSEHV